LEVMYAASLIDLHFPEDAVQIYSPIEEIFCRLSHQLASSGRAAAFRAGRAILMAAVPVITTDAPGCRETVIDGVNGFLVPPRDPEALAEAMERFILHPEMIERMGRASRRMAEERFDVRRINRRMMEEMGLL